MRNLLRLLFPALITLSLYAEEPAATVQTIDSNVTQQQLEAKIRLERERKNLVDSYLQQLDQINDELRRIDSLWQKSYSSYLTYLEVKEDLDQLKERIRDLSKKESTISEKEELAGLLAKEKVLTEQITLLKGQGESPFTTLLKPQELGERPSVTSPFQIFSGISYKKHITDLYQNYRSSRDELEKIVRLMRDKEEIYKNLLAVDKTTDHRQSYLDIVYKLEKFETALGTVTVTLDVYGKRIEEVRQAINEETQVQIYKLLNIGVIIVVLFLLLFLVKIIIKKYIIDNERYYMANKILNFTNFTLIVIILIFNYIENVSYLITVLGFASAGIAIAMKDWFMSMLGWLVIVLGGSIHVGDRIRVDMDGMTYVGDVLDISLLRMTILEDVTYTTYLETRRAGRIIFIPNNYIFTRMIANYSHSSLKTVWDGIDIAITFDSNSKKAMHIAKEVSRKYSKGYTDITRKQLNKLRDRYSLKNTNVEPRVFSLAEPHGIVISTWYLTNAYATMTLRSVISTDIIEAYLAEDDIQIAYPTQRLYLNDNKKRKLPSGEGEEVI